jgi:hypothetical protein
MIFVSFLGWYLENKFFKTLAVPPLPTNADYTEGHLIGIKKN